MSNKNKKRTGIVYSTNPDFNYDDSAEETGHTDGPIKLRIWLEKNQRGGKKTSVIKGYSGPASELLELCRELKQKLGTGGSVKHGEIIIQGDFRDKIVELLNKKGLDAKKAGG